MKTIAAGMLLVAGLALGPALVAEEEATVAATITARLKQARPDFNVASVRPTPIAGIYEVQLSGGPMIYASADGEYFIHGDLFDVQDDGLVNLAERRRDEQRRELLAAVNTEEMLVFAPEGETQTWIAVFTDVDCGFCRKMHQEVPELNRRGIEVRYLAYPRAGIGSGSYRKIASAWCAENPQDALTRVKNGETIPENVCSDNPVANQFVLGQQMGVRGTPALVLEDGTMIPGYVEAGELAARLGVK